MQDAATETLPEGPEIPAMTVWPSIAAYPLGRLVGRLCSVRLGIGKFFTLGKLLAVATIPLSLLLFFWRLAPKVARRYTLTDRRVVIREGLAGTDGKAVGLLDFDGIDVEVLPGQEFLRAGDLVFKSGAAEVFRLEGVPSPESFRQTCLKARTALARVHEVLEQQSKARDEAAAAATTS